MTADHSMREPQAETVWRGEPIYGAGGAAGASVAGAAGVSVAGAAGVSLAGVVVPEPASVAGAAGGVSTSVAAGGVMTGGVTGVGAAAGSQPTHRARDNSPMNFFISVFLPFSPRRGRAVSTSFPAG